MSVAALQELIVIFTGVVRNSHYGSMIFNDTQVGDMHFNAWQNSLLTAARDVHDHWEDDDWQLSELAIDTFEHELIQIFPETGKIKLPILERN